MRSSCSLSVCLCPCIPLVFTFCMHPRRIKVAYKIALLSVFHPLIFPFPLQSVPYQRKVRDYFFAEFIVNILCANIGY
jgi:hypothetical protein